MKISSFDTGLEAILHEGALEELNLPESTALIPGDEPLERHLRKLLQSGSTEERILDWLRPALANREITIPVKFQSLFNKTGEQLQNELQGGGSTEQREALLEAVDLLKEQEEMMGLLNTYRMLLMRG